MNMNLPLASLIRRDRWGTGAAGERWKICCCCCGDDDDDDEYNLSWPGLAIVIVIWLGDRAVDRISVEEGPVLPSSSGLRRLVLLAVVVPLLLLLAASGTGCGRAGAAAAGLLAKNVHCPWTRRTTHLRQGSRPSHFSLRRLQFSQALGHLRRSESLILLVGMFAWGASDRRDKETIWSCGRAYIILVPLLTGCSRRNCGRLRPA
ncbi:hypothetical protein VTK73DRAFT_4123 [Phialemonium thermophilum]|uniref:Uncharacterized protein n=1 Tax=Phialemonium thermophilum TaxID=223376 RepID=A0ABR3VBB4_9PEZI